MKNSFKIILSQVVSLVSAYFVASWIGEYFGKPSDGGLFVGLNSIVAYAFFFLPIIYVGLITFVSNLRFLKLSKWNFIIPSIFVLIFEISMGYNSGGFWFGIKYWLIAFLGGWILAWIVNFFADLIKSK